MSAYEHTDGFWLGKLSAHIGISAQALKHEQSPKLVRGDLEGVLRDFLASPVPSEELRHALREYLK